jgi:hypothetical protein
MDRVYNWLDYSIAIESKQLGVNLCDVSARVERLVEKKIVQIESGQRSVLIVELEWRHFVYVPPVLGQRQIVFALSVQVLGYAVNDVLAKRLGERDSFVGIVSRQAVEYQIDSFWANPFIFCRQIKKKLDRSSKESKQVNLLFDLGNIVGIAFDQMVNVVF